MRASEIGDAKALLHSDFIVCLRNFKENPNPKIKLDFKEPENQVFVFAPTFASTQSLCMSVSIPRYDQGN